MKRFPRLAPLIRLANQAAEVLRHDYIGADSFLIALARSRGRVAGLLASAGATPARIADALRTTPLGRRSRSGQLLLDSAVIEANRLGHRVVRPEHVLLAILADATSPALHILRALYVDIQALRTETLSLMVRLDNAFSSRALDPDEPVLDDQARARLAQKAELMFKFGRAMEAEDFETAAALRAELKKLGGK